MDEYSNTFTYKEESHLAKTDIEADCSARPTSTSESSEIIISSEVACDTRMELSSSSQLPPQRSEMYNKELGSIVPGPTSVLQSSPLNGEESSHNNTNCELPSSISTISITPSVLTTVSDNGFEKITDSLNDQSNLENGVAESILPAGYSQFNVLESINSSVFEKMDSSFDYNCGPQIPDSSHISNQQIPVNGDVAVREDHEVHTNLTNGYSNYNIEDNINDCNTSNVTDLTKDYSNVTNVDNIHDGTVSSVTDEHSNCNFEGNFHDCIASNDTELITTYSNGSTDGNINDCSSSNGTDFIIECSSGNTNGIINVCTAFGVSDLINSYSNGNTESSIHDNLGSNVCINSVVVKQDPYDIAYQRTELKHSVCSLVVYSDSDDDGTSDDCTGSCIIVKQEPYDSGYEIPTGTINNCTGLFNGYKNDNTDGSINKCTASNFANDCGVSSVIFKEEPYDADYERPELKYRVSAIVVDSDDDTSSTLSSNNVPSIIDIEDDYDDYDYTSDEEPMGGRKVHRDAMSKYTSRTAGEVFPEELPSIEYLTISPDEDVVLEHIGTVSGIVGVLVIVRSNRESPALYDDTVLFLNGRKPLGLIFEIFGTVEQPFYSVRFNSNKDIIDRNISIGDKVFFAPKVDNLTKYVFLSELKKIQTNDASWEDDNEPPPYIVEFSDDEEERRALQRQQSKLRVVEENPDGPARRRRRRRKPHSEHEKDPSGPRLLQGDLNKNPFGNKNKRFSSSVRSRRSKSGPDLTGKSQGLPGNRPPISSHSSPQPLLPQPSSSFGSSRPQQPPRASFGERPGWNCQAHFVGAPPNAPVTGPPNFGCFGNNMFNHFRPPPPFNSMPFPLGPQPPQNPPPPQKNNFGCPPYLPRPSMEPINTSVPPPPPPTQSPNFQVRPPHFFPVFNSSQPPPVANAVFTQPPPPLRPPVPR